MKPKATLHVKLDPEEDRQLASRAREAGKSKGQLVREAIQSCYQTNVGALPSHQREALTAYQAGYISLGKLSEVMGLAIPEVRDWLGKRGQLQPAAFSMDDARHAE
ncbi:MAG: ribbon-helix-helix protein, CopG family [Kiritimatiellia bacterium]